MEKNQKNCEVIPKLVFVKYIATYSKTEIFIYKLINSNTMSLISGKRLRRLVETGRIVIDPPVEEKNIQPASIDLKFGEQVFRASDKNILRLKKGKRVDLRPGELAVVTTLETIKLPRNIAAKIGLRSEFTRRGLLLLSGPQVDPGYEGKLFLTLINLSSKPISVYVGQEFVTLEFFYVKNGVEKYKGAYQGKYELDISDVLYVKEGGYWYQYDRMLKDLKNMQTMLTSIIIFSLSSLMIVIPLLVYLLNFTIINKVLGNIFATNFIYGLVTVIMSLIVLIFIIIWKK